MASRLHHFLDDLQVLHLWVLRVLLHQLGRDQFWPLREQVLIAVKDIVKSDLILRL